MRVDRAGSSTGVALLPRTVAVTMLLALMASAGLAQERPRYSELPNFFKVNEYLYRGGQPRSGGVRKLTEIGIRTIINLRGDDELTRSEEAEAKAAGLSYFNISLPALSRPSDEQVLKVMAIVEAKENWPVFVHCKRGSDRTGTVIAIYRITHDGWTGSQAMSEAKRFGLSWMEFGMKDYISDYYRNRNAGSPRPSEGVSQQPVKRSGQ